jgi:hypothetical protein
MELVGEKRCRMAHLAMELVLGAIAEMAGAGYHEGATVHLELRHRKRRSMYRWREGLTDVSFGGCR